MTFVSPGVLAVRTICKSSLDTSHRCDSQIYTGNKPQPNLVRGLVCPKSWRSPESKHVSIIYCKNLPNYLGYSIL